MSCETYRDALVADALETTVKMQAVFPIPYDQVQFVFDACACHRIVAGREAEGVPIRAEMLKATGQHSVAGTVEHQLNRMHPLTLY